MKFFPVLAAAGLSLGVLGAPGSAAPVPAKLTLGPCTVPGLPPDARCGTYEVFENRAARSGRTLPLRVVVLPATGPERLNDPLIYFAGGPGDSSAGSAAWVGKELEALRARRDLLFVDFRGTGGSAGLYCTELQGATGVQGFLDNYLPAEAVKRCAERLGKTADLTQYTSDTSMDDIDDIRAALGYEKLNLYGTSAGTRAALVYLRRHPERVRTMVLWGVVPPDELGPFTMAKSVQVALDGLIAECEQDAPCHGAFPRLRAEVAEVLLKAEREPVTVRLLDAQTGTSFDLRLSKSGVAQTLRYMLYVPASAAELPLAVHLAATGDWKPLAETARFFATNLSSIADGYYLALTCSEDIPFLPEKEIPAAVAGTFLGDFRIRQQQAACAVWPAARVGREVLQPIPSTVPTLMISGERDPVTPASHVERVARHLPNSRQIVVPDGAHGMEGIQGAECLGGLITALVESGSVAGLDTAGCAAATKRSPFVLAREPEVRLTAEQLALLAGTYVSAELGLEVKVEALEGALRATLGDQGPTLLVPASATRFRLEGLPPGYAVVFELVDGKPTAALLEQPGAPSQRLARKP
jgi:pimeloyl-ACP methyl ester carboxylesterase